MKLFSKHLLLGLSLFLFLVLNQEVKSQDQRYSQYYAAPARVNPALAGVIDGAFRVGLNYRTQWGSNMYKAYNSASFTADARFSVFKEDFVGVGFNAMYDRAGIGGYSITEIGIDANYQKKLYQGRGSIGKYYTQFLIAGAHIGLGQRSINWDKLSFSQQYDSEYAGYYNPNINSGENMGDVRMNRLYPEIHAGVLWYSTFGKRRSAYGGASIFHLNRPNISFFVNPPTDSLGNQTGSGVEKLYTRFTIHGGGEIQVGDRTSPISLTPGIVMMFQGPSTEVNFGLGMKYQEARNDNYALRFGLWGRLTNQFLSVNSTNIGIDAMVLHLGLDYENIRFGISYDATLSKLSAINNTRGSFEFSLIYLFPGDFKRQIGCPVFN